MQAHIVAKGCNMVIRIENFDIRILFNISCFHIAGTSHIQHNRFGGHRVQSRRNSFYIQDDFRYIFLNTVNSGDFVKYAINFDTCNSDAGEGAEQYAAQGVTQSNPIASFQRLDHKRARFPCLAHIQRHDIRLFYFDHNNLL